MSQHPGPLAVSITPQLDSSGPAIRCPSPSVPNLSKQVTASITSYSIDYLHEASQSSRLPIQFAPQFQLPVQTSSASPIRPPAEPTPLLNSEHHSPSSRQAVNRGLLTGAHDFIMSECMFINNLIPDYFKQFLFGFTIPDSAFDSYNPNPHPRCYPGTRSAILQRLQTFIVSHNAEKQMCLIIGSLGVGKSAVMQSIAEYVAESKDQQTNVTLGASIFLPATRRCDGNKIILTLVYQLAVKSEPYCRFIQNEITRDPSLLQKSIYVQFNRLIVEPFKHQCFASRRYLVLVDGLDECSDLQIQRDILDLVSNFCTKYSTSSLVWIVASRPGQYITSFLSRPDISSSYEKLEIQVDSDDAREDVKCFLRDALRKVQMESIVLKHSPHWPSDSELNKIAQMSGGLFAHASAIVAYIGDFSSGDPASRLKVIINSVDASANCHLEGSDYPMARLDALYKSILSKIPPKVMKNTRKLLLFSLDKSKSSRHSFRHQCNLLGLTREAAYGAVYHAYSILRFPEPGNANEGKLEFFHKSLQDFIMDFDRSGLFRDVDGERQRLVIEYALRIVREVPNGLDLKNVGGPVYGGGRLRTGRGSRHDISLSWPADEGLESEDDLLRVGMYRESIMEVVFGFERGEEAFCNPLCVHVLSTCFDDFPEDFPKGRQLFLNHRVSQARSSFGCCQSLSPLLRYFTRRFVG